MKKLLVSLILLFNLFACSPSTSPENTNSSTTTENLNGAWSITMSIDNETAITKTIFKDKKSYCINLENNLEKSFEFSINNQTFSAQVDTSYNSEGKTISSKTTYNATISSNSELSNGIIKSSMTIDNETKNITGTFNAKKISNSTDINAIKDGTAKIKGIFRENTINTEVPVFTNFIDYTSLRNNVIEYKGKLLELSFLTNNYIFRIQVIDSLSTKTTKYYPNFNSINIYKKDNTDTVYAWGNTNLNLEKFIFDTLSGYINFKCSMDTIALNWKDTTYKDTLNISIDILKE